MSKSHSPSTKETAKISAAINAKIGKHFLESALSLDGGAEKWDLMDSTRREIETIIAKEEQMYLCGDALALGFVGSNGSVELCCIIPKAVVSGHELDRKSQAECVEKAVPLLLSRGYERHSLSPIVNLRVPILRYRTCNTKSEVMNFDLSFDGHSIRRGWLLREYLKQTPCARVGAAVLKRFTDNELTAKFHITSETILFLWIHFLLKKRQMLKFIAPESVLPLPCSADEVSSLYLPCLADDLSESQLTELGDLLINFFSYFSNDADDIVVSLRTQKQITKTEKGWIPEKQNTNATNLWDRTYFYLCVEDPYQNVNLAHRVTRDGFEAMKRSFSRQYHDLPRQMKDATTGGKGNGKKTYSVKVTGLPQGANQQFIRRIIPNAVNVEVLTQGKITTATVSFSSQDHYEEVLKHFDRENKEGIRVTSTSTEVCRTCGDPHATDLCKWRGSRDRVDTESDSEGSEATDSGSDDTQDDDTPDEDEEDDLRPSSRPMTRIDPYATHGGMASLPAPNMYNASGNRPPMHRYNPMATPYHSMLFPAYVPMPPQTRRLPYGPNIVSYHMPPPPMGARYAPPPPPGLRTHSNTMHHPALSPPTNNNAIKFVARATAVNMPNLNAPPPSQKPLPPQKEYVIPGPETYARPAPPAVPSAPYTTTITPAPTTQPTTTGPIPSNVPILKQPAPPSPEIEPFSRPFFSGNFFALLNGDPLPPATTTAADDDDYDYPTLPEFDTDEQPPVSRDDPLPEPYFGKKTPQSDTSDPPVNDVLPPYTSKALTHDPEDDSGDIPPDLTLNPRVSHSIQSTNGGPQRMQRFDFFRKYVEYMDDNLQDLWFLGTNDTIRMKADDIFHMHWSQTTLQGDFLWALLAASHSIRTKKMKKFVWHVKKRSHHSPCLYFNYSEDGCNQSEKHTESGFHFCLCCGCDDHGCHNCPKLSTMTSRLTQLSNKVRVPLTEMIEFFGLTDTPPPASLGIPLETTKKESMSPSAAASRRQLTTAEATMPLPPPKPVKTVVAPPPPPRSATPPAQLQPSSMTATTTNTAAVSPATTTTTFGPATLNRSEFFSRYIVSDPFLVEIWEVCNNADARDKAEEIYYQHWSQTQLDPPFFLALLSASRNRKKKLSWQKSSTSNHVTPCLFFNSPGHKCKKMTTHQESGYHFCLCCGVDDHSIPTCQVYEKINKRIKALADSIGVSQDKLLEFMGGGENEVATITLPGMARAKTRSPPPPNGSGTPPAEGAEYNTVSSIPSTPAKTVTAPKPAAPTPAPTAAPPPPPVAQNMFRELTREDFHRLYIEGDAELQDLWFVINNDELKVNAEEVIRDHWSRTTIKGVTRLWAVLTAAHWVRLAGKPRSFTWQKVKHSSRYPCLYFNYKENNCNQPKRHQEAGFHYCLCCGSEEHGIHKCNVMKKIDKRIQHLADKTGCGRSEIENIMGLVEGKPIDVIRMRIQQPQQQAVAAPKKAQTTEAQATAKNPAKKEAPTKQPAGKQQQQSSKQKQQPQQQQQPKKKGTTTQRTPEPDPEPKPEQEEAEVDEEDAQPEEEESPEDNHVPSKEEELTQLYQMISSQVQHIRVAQKELDEAHKIFNARKIYLQELERGLAELQSLSAQKQAELDAAQYQQEDEDEGLNNTESNQYDDEEGAGGGAEEDVEASTSTAATATKAEGKGKASKGKGKKPQQPPVVEDQSKKQKQPTKKDEIEIPPPMAFKPKKKDKSKDKQQQPQVQPQQQQPQKSEKSAVSSKQKSQDETQTPSTASQPKSKQHSSSEHSAATNSSKSQSNNATSNQQQSTSIIPDDEKRKRAEEWRKKGNELYQADNYRKSIECYSNGIQADPTLAVLYSNRATAYCKLEKFDKARQDAQTCINLQPTWARGYQRLGQVCMAQLQWKEGAEAYAKVLEIDPNDKDSYERHQTCLSKLQSVDVTALCAALKSPETSSRAAKMICDELQKSRRDGVRAQLENADVLWFIYSRFQHTDSEADEELIGNFLEILSAVPLTNNTLVPKINVLVYIMEKYALKFGIAAIKIAKEDMWQAGDDESLEPFVLEMRKHIPVIASLGQRLQEQKETQNNKEYIAFITGLYYYTEDIDTEQYLMLLPVVKALFFSSPTTVQKEISLDTSKFIMVGITVAKDKVYETKMLQHIVNNFNVTVPTRFGGKACLSPDGQMLALAICQSVCNAISSDHASFEETGIDTEKMFNILLCLLHIPERTRWDLPILTLSYLVDDMTMQQKIMSDNRFVTLLTHIILSERKAANRKHVILLVCKCAEHLVYYKVFSSSGALLAIAIRGSSEWVLSALLRVIEKAVGISTFSQQLAELEGKKVPRNVAQFQDPNGYERVFRSDDTEELRQSLPQQIHRWSLEDILCNAYDMLNQSKEKVCPFCNQMHARSDRSIMEVVPEDDEDSEDL